jgi:hypothetical protein
MILIISAKVREEELKNNIHDAESERNELESWGVWGHR